MTMISTGAAWRPYLRQLADAGFDVASVGAWIAAGELPPARRRLARGALAAVTAAVAVPGIRAIRSAAAEPTVPGAGSGLPFVDVGIRLPDDDPSEADPPSRRRAVLVGAVGVGVLAASVGSTMAVRRLERRWLARLIRHGHPHPHRALGLRMAGLYGAVVLPARLLALRQGTQASRRAARSATGDGTTAPG